MPTSGRSKKPASKLLKPSWLTEQSLRPSNNMLALENGQSIIQMTPRGNCCPQRFTVLPGSKARLDNVSKGLALSEAEQ